MISLLFFSPFFSLQPLFGSGEARCRLGTQLSYMMTVITLWLRYHLGALHEEQYAAERLFPYDFTTATTVPF